MGPSSIKRGLAHRKWNGYPDRAAADWRTRNGDSA
jgi:hypothetical protein